MASTISGATMTVTIQEAVTINGKPQGNTNTNTYANIRECNRRIVTVPTVEKEILAIHASAPGAGTFVETDTRYIRITNKDDTNHVTLTFKSAGNHEFAIKLDATQTFIFQGDNEDGMESIMDASASALTVSLADLVNITALANSSSVDLEIFVAQE